MIEAKQFLIQLKGKTKNVVLKISQLRMVKQKMNAFCTPDLNGNRKKW